MKEFSKSVYQKFVSDINFLQTDEFSMTSPEAIAANKIKAMVLNQNDKL